MVKLNKIYTRTGDAGQTGLADGSRCAKYVLRIEAYGTVDEANSSLGVARLYVQDPLHDAMLVRMQGDLFDLGADLSTPLREGETPGAALRILPSQVTRLEQEIDRVNANLSPLTSFVLPGGTPAAAHLHLARTIVRRAERLACHLAAEEVINPEAIIYLNRLSDLLFVLARASNDGGAADVLWKPGATR